MIDAIIVLANSMDRLGNLNDEAIARLSVARSLWAEQKAPVIVTCGWAFIKDCDITLAEAMKAHAMKVMGLPENAILTEPISRDTVGEAVFTKRNLSNRRGWQTVLVVTSAYHAERTRRIFSFVYGYPVSVMAASGLVTAETASVEAKSLQAFEATFEGIAAGDDRAIYGRLRERHPFYNGTIHPAI